MPFQGLSDELIYMDTLPGQDKLFARYYCLLRYFRELTTQRLIATPVDEELEETHLGRLGIKIKSSDGKFFMSGIVHRPSDLHGVDATAAGEAFTFQEEQNERNPWTRRPVFRFFTASTSTIRFCKGDMRNGSYEFEKEFEPVFDAIRIYDYLRDAAVDASLWTWNEPINPHIRTPSWRWSSV